MGFGGRILGIRPVKLVSTIPARVRSPGTKEFQFEEEYQIWKADFGGSRPEFMVFRTLEDRGLEFGLDFEYQASKFGGRTRLGGAIVDFILRDGKIAGRVQGEFYHFSTFEQKSANIIQRAKLEASGFTVVDMLAQEVMETPNRVVSLFLQGRQTSLARTFVQ